MKEERNYLDQLFETITELIKLDQIETLDIKKSSNYHDEVSFQITLKVNK